ncbi:tetratricopeptide repeat protein [Leptospira sp. 96542]|nr:tetratricopeptide repeat protein [Leptospira sp. 96542]
MSSYLKGLIYLFIFISIRSASAENLDQFWKAVEKSKEVYEVSDLSPKRFQFRIGAEAPSVILKENINNQIFWFCLRYLDKYHSNFPIPKLKSDIRNTMNLSFGDPGTNLNGGKLNFFCSSRKSISESQIQIHFLYNSEYFQPYKWDYFDRSGDLFLTEEDETKNGKKDSYTYFAFNGCPKEITKDRNEIGGMDEWWYFQNCALTKIEYDVNENGFRERICFYENNKITYCDGVGEREEREAVIAEANNNPNLALSMYRKSLFEYKKEVKETSPRTCYLLKKIASIEYDTKEFTSFNKTLDDFFSSPICNSDSIDVLIFKAYYQLYILQNYKAAKHSYSLAESQYNKTNGEISPEIILNLAYAQFMDNDPLSCLANLEKLNSRRLTAYPRFFLFYYRASCSLDLQYYEDAYLNFKKAQIIGGEKEYTPVILYKLAKSSIASGRETEGFLSMNQALLYNIELYKNIENDPIFNKYKESNIASNFRRKYYLNKEKNR